MSGKLKLNCIQSYWVRSSRLCFTSSFFSFLPFYYIMPTCKCTSNICHMHYSMCSCTFPLTPLNINNDYTSSFLVSTRALSCSRGNFAANLNRAWFSTDERKSSNVRGKNNKRKLSPNRVQRIYNAVFHMFPITQRENEQDSWKECVRAIDVANRQLKRQKGKEN